MTSLAKLFLKTGGEQILDKNGNILIKGEGGQIEKRGGSNKGV